jgi:hypothetical protein
MNKEKACIAMMLTFYYMNSFLMTTLHFTHNHMDSTMDYRE